MLKGLGVLAGGIFIGAVGAEIMRKSCPGGLDKLYAKVSGLGSAAKEAFMDGYRGAAGAPEPEMAEA